MNAPSSSKSLPKCSTETHRCPNGLVFVVDVVIVVGIVGVLIFVVDLGGVVCIGVLSALLLALLLAVVVVEGGRFESL